MVDIVNKLQSDLYRIFIEKERWRYFVSGIKITLSLTFYALVIGIVLGVVVALIRSSWDRLSPTMRRGPVRFLFRMVNAVCEIYLTVIRGTPIVAQLTIIYFVFKVAKSPSAILAFGINSGAYVAEIIRGGIMSIDTGQNEAGRSLGFNYVQTMWYIILPQAIRNIVPALGNEFIVLLKETSVVGYIGTTDLLRGANIVMGLTFNATIPLFTAALIYLALTTLFTQLVRIVERRLRDSDH